MGNITQTPYEEDSFGNDCDRLAPFNEIDVDYLTSGSLTASGNVFDAILSDAQLYACTPDGTQITNAYDFFIQ